MEHLEIIQNKSYPHRTSKDLYSNEEDTEHTFFLYQPIFENAFDAVIFKKKKN